MTERKFNIDEIFKKLHLGTLPWKGLRVSHWRNAQNPQCEFNSPELAVSSQFLGSATHLFCAPPNGRDLNPANQKRTHTPCSLPGSFCLPIFWGFLFLFLYWWAGQCCLTHTNKDKTTTQKVALSICVVIQFGDVVF